MSGKDKLEKLMEESDTLVAWDELFPDFANGELFAESESAPAFDLPLEAVIDQPTGDMEWLNRAVEETKLPVSNGKDQDYWIKRFNEINFAGMDLMAVPYVGSSGKNLLDQHLKLRRIVRDFTRLISYNYVSDLRSAGVSEEGIFYMKKGKIPENYTIRLKYPIDYGGNVDFNNLVFIQEKPFNDMIHSFIDEQTVTEKGVVCPTMLYVPVPVGRVYIPFGSFTGSGGKNKQDRSVYAGFSKAAFDKIAMRAMPGR